MISHDSRGARRFDVLVQDQDGCQAAWCVGGLRTFHRRGARGDTEERADAGDPRSQQPSHQPAGYRVGHEAGRRARSRADGRLRVPRADGRHQRGAPGRCRRGAGAIGVHPAARGDSHQAGMTLLEVLRARRRIAPYVRRTPFVRSSWLSDLTGADVFLKLESVQHSNSFKSRGAFNAIVGRLERGALALPRLVTASAGNHGRALAAAAETFGLPLTVFTPADAPTTKLTAISRHGAELRAEGRDYDEAERMAKAFALDTGAAFISPYNDADVIAGAA